MKIKRNVLVIDDEEIWRLMIRRFLENRGYSVKTVGSGPEALQMLSSFKPDIILSDVRMPEMNGFDFLDTVRQLPVMAKIPVVFLYAIDDFDARKTARDLGATDFIVKPFNEKEIDFIISKYLA
jgi:CheY-like chemotaxis protein